MLRKLILAIFVLLFAVAVHAQQAEIELTKSTEISGYPYTNTGKAFESFFMKPKWEVITDNSGTKTVVFKGVFKTNPYEDYLKSEEYKKLSDEKQISAMVKSLYDVAYDYGLRSDSLYSNDKYKTSQIMNYLQSRAYKKDSSIEVYFRALGNGKSYWVKEYKCETCPSNDVDELYALVLDGRFVGLPGKAKSYSPASSPAPAAPQVVSPAPILVPVPVPILIPAPAPAVESYPDKTVASNTIKIAQFLSLEGETAYFDIGNGEQSFTVSPRALSKVKTLKKEGMAHVTYDTVERYADGKWTTVYTITDIK